MKPPLPHILCTVVIEMKSLFAATCQMPRFEKLECDTKADVLVIGGGIAGILTAHFLKKEGVDVLLVEAERLCGGQTGNTTAKITTLPGFLYADLEHRWGREGARCYFEVHNIALRAYRELAIEAACDFENADFYAYAERNERALVKELAALSYIGAPARFVSRPQLPFETVGAVCMPNQAQFHPLRFLSALTAGLRICENTPVRALFEDGAETVDGKRIRSEYTVVTTHFPFLRYRGGFPLKMYQSRSYVLALENANAPSDMYADGMRKGLSLRRYGNTLLLGGGGHRTGVSGGGYGELTKLADQYFKGSRVIGRFAAQDCMTPDRMPYIGQYTKHTERLFVATGFGKWGMASAMVAAMINRDLILNRPNPYAWLFSPHRTMPPLPLLKNMGSVLLHYIRPTAPRCPHLGCALRWNAQERSWDCPCHGSRFTESGELLDAPATKDLDSPKVKK